MANDLKDFSKRMKKRGAEVETNASQLVRNVATQLSMVLTTDATPVKTGQARNNWVARVGTPYNGFILSNEFDKSGQEQHAVNKVAISKHKGDQTIYLTNNLPYIKRLNNGWSAQAPAGFVEKAVMNVNNLLKRARLLGVRARVQ